MITWGSAAAVVVLALFLAGAVWQWLKAQKFERQGRAPRRRLRARTEARANEQAR